MSEQIINSAWRLVLLSVIFVVAAATMFHLYDGMLELVAGHWDAGVTGLVIGAVLGSAVYALARHRGDLVEFE